MSVADPLAGLADGTAASGTPADAISEQVLAAALDQFAITGIRRTTMAEVARRAGVTRVTIYRRFPSKADLVRAVLRREGTGVVEEIDRTLAGVDDPGERIVEGFVVAVGRARTHPLVHRLFETEPDDLLAWTTVAGGPFLAAARSFLADRLAGADGAVTPELEVAAEVMLRLTQSLVLTPDGVVPVDDEDALRAFARVHLVPVAAR